MKNCAAHFCLCFHLKNSKIGLMIDQHMMCLFEMQFLRFVMLLVFFYSWAGKWMICLLPVRMNVVHMLEPPEAVWLTSQAHVQKVYLKNVCVVEKGRVISDRRGEKSDGRTDECLLTDDVWWLSLSLYREIFMIEGQRHRIAARQITPVVVQTWVVAADDSAKADGEWNDEAEAESAKTGQRWGGGWTGTHYISMNLLKA